MGKEVEKKSQDKYFCCAALSLLGRRKVFKRRCCRKCERGGNKANPVCVCVCVCAFPNLTSHFRDAAWKLSNSLPSDWSDCVDIFSSSAWTPSQLCYCHLLFMVMSKEMSLHVLECRDERHFNKSCLMMWFLYIGCHCSNVRFYTI